LQGHASEEGLAERAAVIAAHGSSALSNALQHESLFLLPLWRMLGKMRWVVQARTLPKTLLVLAALAAATLVLLCFPADFDLAAKGKLQPCVRRDVFAHLDGVVAEVPVKHEQLVTRGQVLARMTNNALSVEIANTEGQKRTTRERIISGRRAELDGRDQTIEQRNQLAGELSELRQVEENIDRLLSLLRQKEEQLVVRADMDGQVVTWNVRSNLLGRPVQKGQLLMTIVDLGGAWELELDAPERRMGHIARAAEQMPDGLQVRFTVASHPGSSFPGRVVEMQRAAEVHGEDGNTVRLRVAIDRDELPDLRTATTVTARIHCGRRPLGYVLFHDLIETLQTRVLFWL
jgi:multidrug efflux pump subunit AcrA (membrane-fusion protein)